MKLLDSRSQVRLDEMLEDLRVDLFQMQVENLDENQMDFFSPMINISRAFAGYLVCHV